MRATDRVRWVPFAALLLSLFAAPPLGSAQEVQEAVQQPQEQAPEEVLPDLRIVRIDVLPEPLVDGAMPRVRLMVHNRSSAVAAGAVLVELVHDRGTPQPLPQHQEVLYMGPDAIAEVTFEVPDVALSASPYTFFAVVDVDDVVREADETNNTAWRRMAVCGGPDSAEIADGFDNDCDDMIDEELGLPADPAAAVRMLEAMRRRALSDAAPLVYALPEPFAPSPIEREVRLRTEEGDFVGRAPTAARRARGKQAERAELSATMGPSDAWAALTLTDWNGELLRSGDPVSFRDAHGETLVAVAGGGGRMVTRTVFRSRERLLTIVKVGADPGALIADGDAVALATSTGHFVSAERGGGGPLRADREQAAGWETFNLIFDADSR